MMSQRINVRNVDSSRREPGWKARLLRLFLALLGIFVFAALAITLENTVGIPFKTSYRAACAVACLWFIGQIASDYRGERWPWIGFWVALLFNLSLFFSPLANLPASKGDLLFFGMPDAAILLAARIFTYRVADDHERAVRQQMILGLVLALAFCAIVLAIMFIPQKAPS